MTVYPCGIGVDRWRGPTASQSLPELAKVLVQFWVFHFAQPLARDDHDIQTRQQLLVQAERIAHQAFQAIALNGELDALFADHQAEAWVIEAVLAGKDEQVFPWNLAGWGVEDRFEMPGCKQSLFPTEVLTHHLCRKIKWPDAYGLWHDDATERRGRSWWPYGHGNRGCVRA